MTKIEDLQNKINSFINNENWSYYLHGSLPNCFENIAFRIGIVKDDYIDESFIHLYEFINNIFDNKNITDYSFIQTDFNQQLITNCLLFMNMKLHYKVDKFITYFLTRLDRVYNFVISHQPLFYSDEERKELKGIPTCWKNTKVTKSEFTNPYTIIPLVYDLLGYNAMYEYNQQTKVKIDTIISYILSDEYQKQVVDGYGISINLHTNFVKSKYFAVGWDLRLPSESNSHELTYMLLLNKFEVARKSKWYQNNLYKYHTYINKEKQYLFPSNYFTIKKTYWVFGLLDFGFTNKRINNSSQYVMELLERKQ